MAMADRTMAAAEMDEHPMVAVVVEQKNEAACSRMLRT